MSHLVLDAILDADECLEVVELGNKTGFAKAQVYTVTGKENDESRRNNSRAEFVNDGLAKLLWGRIKDSAPTVFGHTATGLSNKFKMYRYVPGEKFDWHRDAYIMRNLVEKSFYTVLFYLNDGCIGGETEFEENVKIAPKRGSSLLFKHELLHRGCILEQGEKYVLRTDLFYAKR